MTGNDCPRPEELAAFDDGQLIDEAIESIALHIELCSKCREILQDRNPGGNERGELRREPYAWEPECLQACDLVAGIPHEFPGDEDVLHGVKPDGRDGDPDGFDIDPQEEPTQIDRYTIRRRIRSCGGRIVFEARDPILERSCVVKLIRHATTHDGASEEPFTQEPIVQAKFNHPAIVTAYDAGKYDGSIYLVMEYVHGPNLREYVERNGPLSVKEAMRVARVLMDALDCIHRAGYMHGDIKPSNVVLGENETVKLLDFGLSKRNDDSHSVGVIGSLSYMAPEQTAAGQLVDKRADYYALGATLYFVLTGKVPICFSRPNDLAWSFREIQTKAPVDIRILRPEVPHELAILVHQLLQKPADERPSTASDVLEKLRSAPDAAGHRNSWFQRLAIVVCIVGSVLLVAKLPFFAAHRAPNHATNAFLGLQDALDWTVGHQQDPLPGRIASPAALPRRWQVTTVFPQRGFQYLSMSPAGNRFACFGIDGMVRLYRLDGQSLQLNGLLPESNSSQATYLSLSWTSDARYLAVAGAGTRVSIWDVDRASRLIQVRMPGDEYVNDVVWSPDNRRIAVGTRNGTLAVFDGDGRLVENRRIHQDAIHRLVWSRPESILSIGGDGKLFRTDPETWTSTTLFENKVPLTAMAVHPTDGRIMVGDAAGRVHEASKNQLPEPTVSGKEFYLCEQGIFALSWSPDGRQLAAAAKHLYVWTDGNSDPQVVTAKPSYHENAISVAWAPDASHLLAGFSGNLYQFTPASSDCHLLYQFKNTRVTSLAYNPARSMVAAALLDGTIRQIHRDGTPQATLSPPQPLHGGVEDIAWHPNGKWLASGDGYDGSWARLWDAETGAQWRALPHRAGVLALDWHPHGQWLVTGDEKGGVYVWDIRLFQRLQTLETDSDAVLCVRWNRRGDRLAVGTKGHQLLIYEWDSSNNLRIRHRFADEPEAIRSMTWSPDGVHLAIAGEMKRVYSKNAETGRTLWTVPPNFYYRPGRLAWNARDPLIAVGECGVVEATTGRMVQNLSDNFATAWSEQGELIEGSWNGEVRFWSRHRQHVEWSAHFVGNDSIVFSGSGQLKSALRPELLEQLVYIVEEPGNTTTTRALRPLDFMHLMNRLRDQRN